MQRVRGLLTSAGIDPRRVGRFRWAKKAKVLRAHGQPLVGNLGYVFTSPEIDNFTYELANEHDLATWLAAQLDADVGIVSELLLEARSDPALYTQLRSMTAKRSHMRTEPPLGRRLGWYVIVRLFKPHRVIETGIHDGLGSLVLLSALDRNAAEGVDGELISFDIDATAGWIVGRHKRWDRRIESTVTALEPALSEAPTDLFLHDSLHTYEHERLELEAAARHLQHGGLLLSDNSHATTALQDVCADRGWPYSFFAEQPRNHFYNGAGIGMGRVGVPD